MSHQIVFTDLDGTLLNLDSYSYGASAPALARLQSAGIPVIFCSSKTRAEQLKLQTELNVRAPFIVENGSAIFIPTGYFGKVDFPHETIDGYQVITLGQKADTIVDAIAAYRSRASFSYWGYRDLDLPEICRITGLDTTSARLAMDREFSETLIKGNFEAIEFHHFRLAMDLQGISCISGSKFVTIMGKYANKGKAVILLRQLYENNRGSTVTTIGIGDSGNDLPMLEAVDQAYLVKKPSGKWHPCSTPGLIRIEGVAAHGWHQVVESHLLNAAQLSE